VRLRNVIDQKYTSGNPSGTGGPFVNAPTLEPIEARVLDTTATTPAVKGKLLVIDHTDTNGASFLQNATATVAIGFGNYGIVIDPASSTTSNQVQIVHLGKCQALATSGATITPGMALQADANGNLTNATTPAAGTVLAFALATLAQTTTTATLINVSVGGY